MAGFNPAIHAFPASKGTSVILPWTLPRKSRDAAAQHGACNGQHSSHIWQMDQQAPLATEFTTTEPPSSHWKRFAAIAAGILILAGLILWAIYYFMVGQYFVSTDDAYIGADTSIIAPKIGGYVTAVLVNNNWRVTKGQLLLTIDDRDYQTALAGAKADMQAAAAAIFSDRAQLALQQAKIAGAAALVEGDKAKLALARSNDRRYASLTASGATTEQSSEQASTDSQIAEATLDADNAAELAARLQVNVLNAGLAQANANLAQAYARAEQAALDLSHAQIRAPFAGVIGNKSVAVGDYLTPGTQVMAVVPLDQVYVNANYKETQLAGVRPGQKVSILVDTYPNLKVTGLVDSISPSSGQEFALLPPDNATGNFTKIVQRIPVKIDIALNNKLIGLLLPGMSVEPSIDTRPRH
jgi:membrane fusion protein (multidrug efflux system)